MDTVEVYVIAGPSNVFMGGRSVPGGFEYLARSLFLLSKLNPEISFKVRVGHSIYHGNLGEFKEQDNMEILVQVFDSNIIGNLDSIDPVVEHGTLLNHLFRAIPPCERLLIILDPDCYCTEVSLISNLVEQMRENQLAVVGLPYPAWYPKEYSWETPQLYFSIFDREKFDPSTIDLRAGGQPNFNSYSESKVDSTELKIYRRINRLLMRGNLVKFNSTVPVLLENKISTLNGRFRINPLDTAWRIAEHIGENGIHFKILPYIIKSDTRVFGFSPGEYLANNPDLTHLEEYLGWHFVNHGLLEGRSLGSQGFMPRLLMWLMRSSPISTKKWPVDSLIVGKQIDNLQLFNFIRAQIPEADYYAVDNRFAFFHLGSKGKGRISHEIDVLDAVILKILDRR